MKIGVSALQVFAIQSESIPGPSTPAQGVSALPDLNSDLKSGCIGHEASGIPFGNHMTLRNKKCASPKCQKLSFVRLVENAKKRDMWNWYRFT